MHSNCSAAPPRLTLVKPESFDTWRIRVAGLKTGSMRVFKFGRGEITSRSDHFKRCMLLFVGGFRKNLVDSCQILAHNFHVFIQYEKHRIRCLWSSSSRVSVNRLIVCLGLGEIWRSSPRVIFAEYNRPQHVLLHCQRCTYVFNATSNHESQTLLIEQLVNCIKSSFTGNFGARMSCKASSEDVFWSLLNHTSNQVYPLIGILD